MTDEMSTPIDWNQLRSMVAKLKEMRITAKRLSDAYARSQVKAQNRINILNRLSNDLVRQSSTISREIDRHLTELRPLRQRELADQRRLTESCKQAAVRPKLDRGGKRAADRIPAKQGK